LCFPSVIISSVVFDPSKKKGRDEIEEWRDLEQSLIALGFDRAATASLFKLVSAVLYLGQVSVQNARSGGIFQHKVFSQ
jgi:myosin heavy subunit